MITDKDITEAFGEGWEADNTMPEQDPKDEGAEVWNFEEKPIFKGIYIKTIEFDSQFGGKSQLHFVEDEKNVRWKVYGSAIINERFSTAEPGQEIGLVYHGKEKGKKGNFYHHYEVFKKTA